MRWKAVVGFDGKYEVSNNGAVRSLSREIHFMGRVRRSKMKIMKQPLDRYGYPCCTLSLNGRPKTFKVHRLVMQSFFGASNLSVNHKDCNKKNNNLGNLEYLTIKENILHARKNIIYKACSGKNHPNYKLSKVDKRKIVHLKKNGSSAYTIASKFRIHPHTVYKIMKQDCHLFC